jgi:hypothetical protein
VLSDPDKAAREAPGVLDELQRLRDAGFSVFLIGELFIKSIDPGKACGRLIEDTKELQMSSL